MAPTSGDHGEDETASPPSFFEVQGRHLTALLLEIAGGIGAVVALPQRAVAFVGAIALIAGVAWIWSVRASVQHRDRRGFRALSVISIAVAVALLAWGLKPETSAEATQARHEACATTADIRDSLSTFMEAATQQPVMPKFSGPLWIVVQGDLKRLTEQANRADSPSLSLHAATMRESFVAVGSESFPNNQGKHPWLDGLIALGGVVKDCKSLGQAVPGSATGGPPPATDAALCSAGQKATQYTNVIVDTGRPANLDERFLLSQRASVLVVGALDSRTNIGAIALRIGDGLLSGRLGEAESRRLPFWRACRDAGYPVDLGIHTRPKGPSDRLP